MDCARRVRRVAPRAPRRRIQGRRAFVAGENVARIQKERTRLHDFLRRDERRIFGAAEL